MSGKLSGKSESGYFIKWPMGLRGTLGTRLNIKVVPARTFQMGTVLVRNISYRNTTGTPCRDETTRSVAMSFELCKLWYWSFSCLLSVSKAYVCQ